MSDASKPPADSVERIRWVVAAREGKEVERRYDLWAEDYDRDLAEVDGYAAPLQTADSAARLCPRGARVLDAACGTGLVGGALAARGFSDITGLDLSAGMLARARAKGHYRELLQADLSGPLPLPDAAFELVIIVGLSLALPASSFEEFARVAVAGGHILFCGDEAAFAEKLAPLCERLAAAGRLRERERGPAFQPLPNSEPELSYRIIVHEVLRSPGA